MFERKFDGFFPTPPVRVSYQATSVLNLRVPFDEDFNLRKHLKHVTAVFTISAIFTVFAIISLSISKTITIALVGSRLDYCNSLFKIVQARI